MAEAKIRLSCTDGQDRTERDSLMLLYMPLIGQDGVILYETLVSMARLQAEVQAEKLLLLSGLGEGRYAAARKRLEMFGLLNVYENPVSGLLLYQIEPPLSGGTFLRHDIYSRMLLNAVGSRRFDELVLLFSRGREVPEGYLCRTAAADSTVLEAQWSDEKEEALQKLRPRTDVAGFDWEKFYRGRERELPLRMRTRENEELIAGLARLYGLNETQMRVYVMRACPGPLRILDRENLKEMVRRERRQQAVNHDDPFAASPVLFLQFRQNGAPVSDTDRRMLERLHEDYRFTNEVINELLDFVMEQTEGALPTSYVDKIAGTWSRLTIDTRDKARQWRQKQKEDRRQTPQPARNRPASGLPAWYSEMGETGPTEDLQAEIERLRKKRNA